MGPIQNKQNCFHKYSFRFCQSTSGVKLRFTDGNLFWYFSALFLDHFLILTDLNEHQWASRQTIYCLRGFPQVPFLKRICSREFAQGICSKEFPQGDFSTRRFPQRDFYKGISSKAFPQGDFLKIIWSRGFEQEDFLKVNLLKEISSRGFSQGDFCKGIFSRGFLQGDFYYAFLFSQIFAVLQQWSYSVPEPLYRLRTPIISAS